MSEIKWIKLKTDMFNDDKIKLIQALPSGDSIIVIWLRMLILAGISNADGYLMVSENIPYTEEMLGIIFNKPLSIIRLALDTFKTYGMLEENNVGFFITDFSENQSEKIKDIREYNRIKKAESREKARQKILEMSNKTDTEKALTCQDCYGDMSMTCQSDIQDNVNDSVNDVSMTCQGQSQECQGTDIDIDKDINININNNNISPKNSDFECRQERLDYERIVDIFNQTCKDLPKVRSLSDERKRKIKTLLTSLNKSKVLTALDTYGKLQYIFNLADESDFLSGRDSPNNWCGFDWLIQPKNAIKVIEGNYKNKGEAVRHGAGAVNQTDASKSNGAYTSESESEALAAFRAGRGDGMS